MPLRTPIPFARPIAAALNGGGEVPASRRRGSRQSISVAATPCTTTFSPDRNDSSRTARPGSEITYVNLDNAERGEVHQSVQSAPLVRAVFAKSAPAKPIQGRPITYVIFGTRLKRPLKR